jgi:hypothetical protein
MKRTVLQVVGFLIALIITLLIFFSALFIDSVPDRFTEVQAQQLYPTTYQAFLHEAYRTLTIAALITSAILISLVLLFLKISNSLKKIKWDEKQHENRGQ